MKKYKYITYFFAGQMSCIILLVLQFLLIADLQLAVPDSRYSHEYKDNKISVPKLNYFQGPNKIIFT